MRLLANPFLMLAVPFAQLVHIGAMYTPGISNVLALNPITLMQWLALAGVASLLLVIEEGHKWRLRATSRDSVQSAVKSVSRV
jgi:hypothetical protein